MAPTTRVRCGAGCSGPSRSRISRYFTTPAPRKPILSPSASICVMAAWARSARFWTATRPTTARAALRKPGAWPKCCAAGCTCNANSLENRHEYREAPLADGCAQQGQLEVLGSLLERTSMGHAARGLQRPRQCLGVFSARTCAQPGVSLGRGRPGGFLRRAPAPVPVIGPVDWARPHLEGTALRADQWRGQPRRGRQGAVLLSRRHAHTFVLEDALQVSAVGLP